MLCYQGKCFTCIWQTGVFCDSLLIVLERQGQAVTVESLMKVTLDALGQMFQSARGIMAWLGDCAKVYYHICVLKHNFLHWYKSWHTSSFNLWHYTSVCTCFFGSWLEISTVSDRVSIPCRWLLQKINQSNGQVLLVCQLFSPTRNIKTTWWATFQLLEMYM